MIILYYTRSSSVRPTDDENSYANNGKNVYYIHRVGAVAHGLGTQREIQRE